MRRFALSVLTVGLALFLSSTASAADKEEDGFVSIFDGESLKDWDGDPKFWSVKDGTITGQTTAENQTKGNTFIIWQGGDIGDFELKLQYKIVGGNSGIQYRSFLLPNGADKWRIGGYQADFEAGDRYSGICYGEQFRGILADRGQRTELTREEDKFAVKVVGEVGNSDEIGKQIKKEDWNDYHISAKDFQFTHKINGVTTCELTDNDAKERRATGLLALQLHAGPPMTVQFRNIRLKKVEASATPKSLGGDKKKIVFVAGKPSHGYGSHEHYAGSVLLAKALQQGLPGYRTDVIQNGWPEDESVFDGADCVVMYADGGGGHPVIPHSQKMDEMTAKGVGVVCIHYAVEVPAGESGEYFKKWIGGYFEPHWSVNPHWTAKFAKFPEHPIAHGVEPFEINDEWYYHMRFRDNMEGVTPILTDLPGPETLTRPDGPHSGNPDVRAAVLDRKEPQHVAWAATRPDGGRGFGFTGGHVHWNWGDPNFRKLVLNAIVWCAKGEVPKNGVGSEPVTLEQLEQNQDYPQPKDFNRDAIRKQLKLSSTDGPVSSAKTSSVSVGTAKPLYSSPLVTSQTPEHSVAIDVDIASAKQLYLVVTDGGNGFGCDWADWAEPRLIGPGKELKLTDLKWKSASAEWGQVRTGRNAEGGELRIAGKSVEYGIGTHANSVIGFDLPAGYTRFQARGGLDNGGTDQGGGASSSVQFHLFAQVPTVFVAQNANAPVSRQAVDALGQLAIHSELQASLFAAEPLMLNPTNIDIDHLGRIWVCEVVNYRAFRNQDVIRNREQGDRILILEDTDGNGAADTGSTFYQGHDVDSAHGICVLGTPSGKGTRALVSAKDSVFFLIDDDGDLKSDRKELLFTNIDGVEHDHGIHACVFGPDGKLYFNFGNSGKRISDRDGKPIVDMAGNEVNDSRKPYQEGMVFRCNLDGSEFETLGWNFRNNWEVAVDSFGTLWQSDNDDDGNRGTRINFVMEFGNYGYKDEMTGAGWREVRTNLESEVPLQHWHLNDPGVVPNLLQTGAGSPTGICVNEGTLLPSVFRNQIIHCDAGPNVVRAYPVKDSGAGYSAEIVNILEGVADKWFRPSDVCIAPDGSLLVADWYDPGVGGHRMEDVEHGRLFRLLPAGHDGKYSVPKHDFSTATGAVEALQSPNLATRYMAWTALHLMGVAAEPELLKFAKDTKDPRLEARALWLLGKMEGRGAHYVELALQHPDPNVRILGVRLARQLHEDITAVVKKLIRDKSPQVRRELAITLRYNQSNEMPELWAELALQHDGVDRWYLEALGIGADKQWDACLAAYLKQAGDNWNSLGGRDILWRSRTKESPQQLAKILTTPQTPIETHPRYLRAFDFLSGSEKEAALRGLLAADYLLNSSKDNGDVSAAKYATLVEVALRLPGTDVNAKSPLADAVRRHLSRLAGTAQYVELVAKLNVRGVEEELARLALADPASTQGVQAAMLLLQRGQANQLTQWIDGAEEAPAVQAISALGYAGSQESLAILQPLLTDSQRSRTIRTAATTAIGRSRNGERVLLRLVQEGKLAAELQFAAANALFASADNGIRAEAAKRLQLPAAANSKPLPPIAELAKRGGNAGRGQQLFNTTATCLKCHKVRGEGKEVGPELSEIGGKLAKEAMFASILDPSAGISHNYEAYVAVLTSGNVVTGLKMSDTDAAVTIRNAEGIDQVIAKRDLDELAKSPVSLMPADLQKNLSEQDLVDVVEYMTTLKKGA